MEPESSLPDFLQNFEEGSKFFLTVAAECGDGQYHEESVPMRILLVDHENTGEIFYNFLAPRLPDGSSCLWSNDPKIKPPIKVDGISIPKAWIEKGIVNPYNILMTLGQAYLTEMYGNVVKAGPVHQVQLSE
jgi:hypothetical protein